MTALMRACAVLFLGAAAAAPLVDEAVGQDTRPQIRRQAGPPPTSFREDVMPIFKGYCLDCHQPGGAGYETSGVDVRTYDGVMKGTKFGPVVIAKEPEFSSLMRLLDGRVGTEIRMPHNAKKLPEGSRAIIRRWILEGALNN